MCLSSIDGALQLQSNLIDSISSVLFQHAGMYHLSFFFYGGAVWIIGYAMIVIAMFEMILAKIMMAVLFTVAPLMFLFTIFKYTQNIFDRWIGNLIGFTLLLIMISAMLGLIMGILYEFMPITAVANALPDKFMSGLSVGVIPMFICIFVAIYGIGKISAIAMHIGGGASSGNLGAIMGGMMVGAGIGLGKKGVSKGANIWNQGLQKIKDYGREKSRSKPSSQR